MIPLTIILALIILATRHQWRKVRQREAADATMARVTSVLDERARELAAKWESLDVATADRAGRCWVCTAPAHPLELVDEGPRYVLACVPCAHTTKALKGMRQERAA